MKYRKEIDGLRALAIIPVIFYHADIEFFKGGFIGVDIFFIISGYLITSIILRDLYNNSFSLKMFYERRARRILPVLFFVIFVSTFLSFILMTRSELGSFFESANSSILFFSNFHFWLNTPYFESNSDLEPLLHTWSLSIEEQFYIFFPLIIMIIYTFLKQKILFFLIIVFILSLALCQVLATITGGSLNFYLTLSRAWELSLGGIAGYILLKTKIEFSDIFNNLMSIIGLLLIIFSIFFITRDMAYPSLITLIPTIGTILIILFANNKTYVKKILSNQLIVGLGLISYSLYLWHQPLLAFTKIHFHNLTILSKTIIIILSFFLSLLSFKYIEQVFRKKGLVEFKLFIRIIIGFIILFISFSFVNIKFFSSTEKNGTESRLAKELTNSIAVYSSEMDERQFTKYRIMYENLNPNIIVIGSSRTMQISNNLFKENLLNLSVTAANFEDQITISEMALNKFTPNKIILSADPWIFNKNNEQSLWQSLSKEYYISLQNILNKENNPIFDKNINVNHKLNYYENIIEYIYQFLNIRKSKIEKLEQNQKGIIIKRDGQRIYGENVFHKNIKPKVIKYRMNNFEFSKKNYENYKEFIKYLQNDKNIRVVLLLTPFYHDSYEMTKNSLPIYLELEKKFKDLANNSDIEILGSYNPVKSNCKKNEFHDSSHPKISCIKKILGNL